MENTKQKAAKNISFKSRVKAGLLAATALITSGACGRTVVKQEPGANVSIETEANTEKNSSNVITTTTKKGNKTTTNTFVTEPTNNNGYVDNTTNNNYVDNTTNSNTNSTEPKTENKTNPTTNKPTTQNPTHQNPTHQNPTHQNPTHQNPTTAKPTTQKPTTQKPVQTTAKPTTQKPVQTTTVKATEPPTQAPTPEPTQPPVSYDYTLENITKSADVFNAFAESMSLEIQRGSRIQIPDCNGEQYWMYGSSEAKVALLLLNMNKSYDDGVLAKAFEGYSDYDIRNGILYLYRMPDIAELEEVIVNWHDYTDDYSTAEYMNRLMETGKNARETGNLDDFNAILNSYMENPGDNYASLVMTMGYIGGIRGNEYGSMTPEELFGIYAGNYPDEIRQLIR